MRLLSQPTGIILSQPPRSVNRFPREICVSTVKVEQLFAPLPEKQNALSHTLSCLPAVGSEGKAGRRANRSGDPKDLKCRHQAPEIRRPTH